MIKKFLLLSILNYSPANNSTDVRIFNSFYIRFNKPIHQSEEFDKIYIKDSNGKTYYNLRKSINDRELSIANSNTHTNDYNTTYTLYLPKNAISAEDSTSLETDFQISYKTEKDIFPPIYDRSFPKDGTIDFDIEGTFPVIDKV